MADKTETVTLNKAGAGNETVTRAWIDQGDGTHAEKVAAELVVGDAVIGEVDQGAAGEDPWLVEFAAGTMDDVVSVIPVLDTSQYASGDLLFDSTEIANAVRVNGGTNYLISITIIDKADQKAAFTLVFANALTDFGTLNSAPDPDDTEAATVIGWVAIETTDYLDLGSAAVGCKRQIALELEAAPATKSLYVAAVNGTGTPTYGASDLEFKFGFAQS